MKQNYIFRTVFFVFALVAVTPAIIALAGKKTAQEELRVEGILYGQKPDHAATVINGKLLTERQIIQGYRVKKITPTNVRVVSLKDKTESILHITGALPRG